MANNIYNGTFILGSTSATTLSAGLGIKLDTSVPGIIGISNDETVLYSGNTSITTGSLSEPATNFNYLRVSFYEEASGAAYPGGQLVADLDINECLLGHNYNSSCAGMSFHQLGQNVALGLRVGMFYLTSPTTFSSYHVEKQLNSTAAASNIGNMFVTKVIGVNRKQTNGGV